MSTLRQSLLPGIDSVLSVRDAIGPLADIYIVERTWSGERVGDGTYSEKKVKVWPSPQIKDYGHDVRVSEAGAVKQGDLILIGLSRNQYPSEEMLRTEVDSKSKEKMIQVGKHFYRTIHVKEKIVTWDIHIRKINKDESEA